MDTKGKIELKKAFNIPKNQNNDQSILIIFDSFNFGSLSSSSQASRKFREKKEISTSWSIDQSLLGMGAEIYRNSTKIETNGGALSFGTPCKLWVLKKISVDLWNDTTGCSKLRTAHGFFSFPTNKVIQEIDFWESSEKNM